MLRARCPHCRTLTAVAVDGSYECHRCGDAWDAGLVRVHGAWGAGGDAMAEAAGLPLPFPEAAVVEAATLEKQSAAVAGSLPVRPLVLGGCCCAHVGAIRGLAARHERLAVVWFDAHGDLNTPDTSPSGNAWGMPLRMAIDEGAVAPTDVALVGARSLDPPELDYLHATGIDGDVERAVDGATAVYVAFDVDVLEPGELACFMPEPGGPSLSDVERQLRALAASGPPVVGMGVTGLRPEADPAAVTRIVRAAGLSERIAD